MPVGKKHLRPEEIIEDDSNIETILENKFIPQFEDSFIVIKSRNCELTLESIHKQDKENIVNN